MKLENFIRRCARDFTFFAKHCLKIRIKQPNGGTRLGPFVLNKEQKVVVSWMYYCLRNDMAFRIIIDKCRKLGMSTLSEAIGYWLCTFRPFFRSTVIAQTDDDTQVIAEIARTFNNNMPDFMREYAGTPTGNYVKWKDPKNPKNLGSWFRAKTQGGKGGGRGDDPAFLHISELATWDIKRSGTSSEQALTGYLGSIPSEVWTFVVLESTAEGMAGSFYNRFTQAWKMWHDSSVPMSAKEWRPFFFSWQGVEKYTEPVAPEVAAAWASMCSLADTDREKSQSIWGKMPWTRALARHELAEVWYDRVLEYGLTASQMKWASRTLAGFSYDLDKFDQEFPLSWQLSFITSGRPVLNQRIIAKWMEAEWDMDVQVGGALRDLNGHIVLDDFGGSWEIYRQPDPSHEYIVATDSASGMEHGDYAAARVFDRNTREIVAEHYGKIPPEMLGEQAVYAAKMYNDAYIIPEINNHGVLTVKTMLDMGYEHIHARVRDVKPGTAWTAVWGHLTTTTSKKSMVATLAAAVRAESYTENSKRLCDEATTYVYDRWGKPDHMKDRHDDLIDCTALILLADEELRPAEVRAPKLTGKMVPDDFHTQRALKRVRDRAFSKKRRYKRPARL